MEKKPDRVIVGAIQTNCWIYPLDEAGNIEKELKPCIVIDPGDEADLIISRLEKLKWIPHYILLTHGHYDHLAGLPDLLAGFGDPFPKVGIHRLDANYLGKDSLNIHRSSMTAAGGNPAYVDALWNPLPEADIFFEENDTIGPFTVMHLPGHTPGSVSFYDEKAGILFSGDTLFRRGYGRTDLPGGNEGELCQSLKRILSMNGEIIVYSGHGPATTIKEERKTIL
jgi:glyoxylase-like metal-dependent hydrolase (beta-lactamase superfamily II)